MGTLGPPCGQVTSERQGDCLPSSPTETILELLEVTVKLLVFYVVTMVVIRVYNYLQTHQYLYIKHVQLFCTSIIPQYFFFKKKKNTKFKQDKENGGFFLLKTKKHIKNWILNVVYFNPFPSIF